MIFYSFFLIYDGKWQIFGICKDGKMIRLLAPFFDGIRLWNVGRQWLCCIYHTTHKKSINLNGIFKHQKIAFYRHSVWKWIKKSKYFFKIKIRLFGDFQSLCFNLFRYWPIHNLNLRNSISSKILKCILQKSGIFDAGKKVRFWPESDHYRLSDFGCCLTNFFPSS